MGADGRHYVFPPEPFVMVPTISSRMLEYHEQLLEALYEFMEYYQGEHYARMGRIRDNLPDSNLPTTIPIWTLWEDRPHIAGQPGYVQYRHPNEPWDVCMSHKRGGEHYDALAAGIRCALATEYIKDWETAVAFRKVVTAPVITHEWRCNNSARVDVEGYPLTQYYKQDDECVLEGPAPALFAINQDTPMDGAVPANLILPRWPTGPDQRII
eukprot:scaffold70166_cov59-Attheya_sp.AAC.1